MTKDNDDRDLDRDIFLIELGLANDTPAGRRAVANAKLLRERWAARGHAESDLLTLAHDELDKIQLLGQLSAGAGRDFRREALLFFAVRACEAGEPLEAVLTTSAALVAIGLQDVADQVRAEEPQIDVERDCS